MATNLRGGRRDTTRASRRHRAPSPRRAARARPRHTRAPSSNRTPGPARPLLNPRGRPRSRSSPRAPRTARRRPRPWRTRPALLSPQTAPRLFLNHQSPRRGTGRGGRRNEHLGRSALNDCAARRAPVARLRFPAARLSSKKRLEDAKVLYRAGVTSQLCSARVKASRPAPVRVLRHAHRNCTGGGLRRPSRGAITKYVYHRCL